MMDRTTIHEIIEKIHIFDGIMPCVTPFTNNEDGGEYNAWLVSANGMQCVLKKAKGDELAVYETYLKNTPSVPLLFGSVKHMDEDYLFMEYINGVPLQRITRDEITAAIDALTSIQERFWQSEEKECGLSFSDSLIRRTDRGHYLFDAELEAAYESYLHCYKSLPRTLCHDDLLPFNIIMSDKRAVLIDWEEAGILPYPVPLARLLAHTEESESAFFYLKEEDKEFAISYYYHRLPEKKGIAFSEYRKCLDLFIFYEYCERIMVGNKYPDADMTRFHHYKKKAQQFIKKRL